MRQCFIKAWDWPAHVPTDKIDAIYVGKEKLKYSIWQDGIWIDIPIGINGREVEIEVHVKKHAHYPFKVFSYKLPVIYSNYGACENVR